MSAKNKGKILKEAEKITSLIATARCLMSQNKSIDLSKLEQKVSSLCKKAEITDLKQSKKITKGSQIGRQTSHPHRENNA